MKIIIRFLSYFIQWEDWVNYWNQSRPKRDFKGFSGEDYGTHSLNQSHKFEYPFRLRIPMISKLQEYFHSVF